MLAGLILAGGKSSRMGLDKSLLTLPGSQQSLLEYSQKKLALVCDDNVLISGSQHDEGIMDVIPNCGPLSGIHGALTHIESQQSHINELLVVAVDMPDICHEDYIYLLKRGRESQRLCCFENCFLPLYLPLSIDVAKYLSDLLTPKPNGAGLQPKKPQYSIKQMLNSLQGIQIHALKNSQLNNINTPLQWHQRCAEQPFTRA
ncbi:molybdenum cofactor guanylyltransferase [uncultured Paraglaciecola sp.]|uniref:molybdenum cofactor guanylyltransferase n=1 Tax=uncultured Paraglaciecola sp. TaxID=1765024 RepID=UPI0025F97F35|nr:molybdenum cofactor guanylyltransferase [uncultured Paraglaciecola sp.]